MAKVYHKDDRSIGFEDGEAWIKFVRDSLTGGFRVDSSLAPTLSRENAMELAEWIKERSE